MSLQISRSAMLSHWLYCYLKAKGHAVPSGNLPGTLADGTAVLLSNGQLVKAQRSNDLTVSRVCRALVWPVELS